MNGTKKTLTTLTAAAALAIGGIAIAQTTGSDTSAAGASLGSSTTMQNSGDQSLGSTSTPMSSDSSTLSNSGTDTSASTSSDTSAMGASADSGMQPAQVDRN